MREIADITGSEHSLLASLDQLARIVESGGAGTIAPEDRRRAEAQALALARSSAEETVLASVPAVSFVASLLAGMAVDLAADIPAAQRLVDELERAGLPAAAVGHELLRISHVAQLPPEVALHVQLTLLFVCAGGVGSSLWALNGGEQVRLLGQAGEPASGPSQTQRVAEGLLRGAGQASAESELAGAVIERPRGPAALIVHLGEGAPARIGVLLDAAVPTISATLDRLELLAAGESDGPGVIASLERRLARLRYDLHDGPQQDVHLLGMDLRLFRDQLATVLREQPDAWRLLGRLDDLEAQLVALDSELRHIATAMQSPFLPAGTLPDALEEVTEAFRSRTGVEPTVELTGDLAALSDSQQIALLALVREGLNNIQKHAGASHVTITIAAHNRGVDAQITDDGCGFDPEETLVRAAREGHLGVVGIHERVRMLGGQARIVSRLGGPTVISVSLPVWNADRSAV